MNKTTEATKPYPYGRTETLPPLEEKVTNGIVAGYNPVLSNSVALAERRKAEQTPVKKHSILKRVAALALATGITLGAVKLATHEDASPKTGGDKTSQPEAAPTNVVNEQVRPGDSAWTMVERENPNADPRPLVDEMLQEKAVKDGLVAGEIVPVPVNHPEDHQK